MVATPRWCRPVRRTVRRPVSHDIDHHSVIALNAPRSWRGGTVVDGAMAPASVVATTGRRSCIADLSDGGRHPAAG